MTILFKICSKWATIKALEKAAKQVRISSTDLHINWIDQTKFKQAEAILKPPSTLLKTTPWSQYIDFLANYQKGS